MTGTALSSAGVEALIDRLPLNRAQVGVIAACAAVAMIDGFDTQLIGLVAPEIARSWGTAPAAFGPPFAAGLLGGMIGGFVFGAACDRLGRRPSLLVAITMFALLSLATPLAPGIGTLTVLRLLTGLGLGGAFPCIIAIATEVAPRAMRTRVVGWMFCGFPLGAVVASVVAALVLPRIGWPAMFLIGGGAPLLLLPLLWWAIPESLRFLGVRRDTAGYARAAARAGLPVGWNGEFDAATAPPRATVAALFAGGRAGGTLAVWTTLFLSLLMAYFLLNWLPLVVRLTGTGAAGASLAVGALNAGTVAGVALLSRWASRRPGPAIAAGYAVGAVVILLIGQAGHSTALLLAACFLAGLFATGAQICTIALGAAFYETALRATGVGWSMGVARIGGVVGPLLGGVLIGWGAVPAALFAMTGGVSLAAAAAGFVAGRLAGTARDLSQPSGTADAAGPSHP